MSLLAHFHPLVALGLFLTAWSTPVQGQRAEVLEMVELTFTSARAYDDPHRQGALRVAFAGPDGKGVTVDGFWDGERTFRARFAPPAPGTWRYRSTAIDVTNPGLHGLQGEIEVVPYTGTDPFRNRGWPRTSDDGRHLSYGDGEPLFLLADWAAEAGWRSGTADVIAYLDDRAAKGFNAIQVVASSHNRHFPEGVTNQKGQPLHLPYQPDRLNPRYFDHLDWVVSEANARGLAVMLYPIWAATVEIHEPDNDWYAWYVPDEAALFRARYVSARYAGHNVVWVIGGDQYYDRHETRVFWRNLARVVREASGGEHLMTSHSSGWSGTFQYFNAPEDDWIDFHAYTPGHWGGGYSGGYWSYEGAIAGTAAAPGKPLFSIESNFEDLFHRFWDYTADTTGTFRLQDVHVREAAYWGLLSGAIAGYAYGANGIWQWTTEETIMEPGDFWPRHTVTEAINYPGSFHVSALRRIMEELDWTDLFPRQSLLLYATQEDHIAVAAAADRIVAYLPRNTTTASFSTAFLKGEKSFRWIDVRSGQSAVPRPASGPILTVSPPDAQDWLLVVTSSLPSDTTAVLPAPALQGSAAPNPFRTHTALRLRPTDASSLEIVVYDVLGRQVHHGTVPAPGASLVYPLALPIAGVYVCRVLATRRSGSRDLLTFKLLSLGN